MYKTRWEYQKNLDRLVEPKVFDFQEVEQVKVKERLLFLINAERGGRNRCGSDRLVTVH